MSQNDFVPFAVGTGANVYSPATYAALAARLTGVVDGEADPLLANNSWRQGTVIGSMIGAFIAANGYDALDNGDLGTLLSNFEAALTKYAVASPSIIAQSPVGRGLVAFGSAGPGTWRVPSVAAGNAYDVYWVYMTCVGAGAGGSGCALNGTQSGAGGGAGGTAAGWFQVTPGQVLTFVVGDGSTGVGYQTQSANGGTSSIGSYMSATGGGGTTNSGLAGGSGGIGMGGQVNYRGGVGVDGNSVSPLNPAGPGGASSLGGGGRSATQYNPVVCDGQAPGSGGGGIYNNQFNNSGGRGAPGYVSFLY